MNKNLVNFLNNQPLCDQSYRADNRCSIWDLYKKYLALDVGWHHEIIYWQNDFPILLFKTKKKGPALWILAGIHGEEPAGPNAIGDNIQLIGSLAEKGIPMVLLPLCNPLGYFKNWRYPNECRDFKLGKSVGDSEHLLFNNDLQPRLETPACNDANQFTHAVLKNLPLRPPAMAIDFHEDEDQKKSDALSYIYSQGKMGVHDPVAHLVIDILERHDVPLKKTGMTRFGDPIHNGIVNASEDGSVDELLAAPEIYLNGAIVAKPFAKTVIVVETLTLGIPLEKRVMAHSEIIESLDIFYHMALES